MGFLLLFIFAFAIIWYFFGAANSKKKKADWTQSTGEDEEFAERQRQSNFIPMDISNDHFHVHDHHQDNGMDYNGNLFDSTGSYDSGSDFGNDFSDGSAGGGGDSGGGGSSGDI